MLMRSQIRDSWSINQCNIVSERITVPPKCNWPQAFLPNRFGIYCVCPKLTKCQSLTSYWMMLAHSLRVNITICGCNCSGLIYADNKYFCRGIFSLKPDWACRPLIYTTDVELGNANKTFRFTDHCDAERPCRNAAGWSSYFSDSEK